MKTRLKLTESFAQPRANVFQVYSPAEHCARASFPKPNLFTRMIKISRVRWHFEVAARRSCPMAPVQSTASSWQNPGDLLRQEAAGSTTNHALCACASRSRRVICFIHFHRQFRHHHIAFSPLHTISHHLFSSRRSELHSLYLQFSTQRHLTNPSLPTSASRPASSDHYLAPTPSTSDHHHNV